MRSKLSTFKKRISSQALEFVVGSRSYVGHIDDLQSGIVRGWVGCTQDSGPVCIKVTKGNEVKVLLASDPRPDVVAANMLHHESCGFNVSFSKSNNSIVSIDIMVQAQSLFESIPDYSQRKLFFVHIPKAAGSSINDFIPNAIGHTPTYTHIEGMRDKWAEISQSKFLSGHIRYPEYVKFFSKFDYVVFAFLREPYSHLRSHINWVRRLAEPEFVQARESHAKIVQNISDYLSGVDFTNLENIEKFVTELKPSAYGLFDNCQVRYLSSAKGSERVTEVHLQEAITNLRKLHFVGISERSKESQAMLLRLMRLPAVEGEQRSNVNTLDFGLNIKAENLRSIIAPLVCFDLQLYSVALQLFKQQEARFHK